MPNTRMCGMLRSAVVGNIATPSPTVADAIFVSGRADERGFDFCWNII